MVGQHLKAERLTKGQIEHLEDKFMNNIDKMIYPERIFQYINPRVNLWEEIVKPLLLEYEKM